MIEPDHYVTVLSSSLGRARQPFIRLDRLQTASLGVGRLGRKEGQEANDLRIALWHSGDDAT